jgi:hypothetical protein
MNKYTQNQVVIYHDETKDVAGRNYKGHVLFFVLLKLTTTTHTPLFGVDVVEYSPHELLYEKIVDLRNQFRCDGKFHFSQISGKTWEKYDFAYRNSIDITTDGLRHKHQREFPYPLNCKLAILFYPKGADWSIYGGSEKKEQKLRHDETLLRMLLKGAAHFLYNEDNQIEVKRLVTDGSPSHRNFDKERIIRKLTYENYNGRTPLRDYVSFSNDTEIIHLPSNHKDYSQGSEEYKAANMLQMADLLLGAVMRSCYHGIRLQKKLPKIGDECNKRDIISQPIKEMLDKQKRGGGFLNSGHFRSFTISEVGFSKNGVNFREICPMELSILDTDSMQINLFPQNNT